MAVYSLDEAVQILFDDREYYLSLSKSDRSKMRNYKIRFKSETLSTDTKISLIKNYGGKVNNNITVEL
ncbi:hypothetical protein QQ020_20105 [Fulvivirgaceae bacterium BMA12]|uniref:Uncharacterized protein n=1 Tax=Agaribacillus aureus TaxID=3051825 RepID=A0ABT8L9F8_9BACT|nr:hypothetical protein [Fulvivirgaceae bacterium BMA12]